MACSLACWFLLLHPFALEGATNGFSRLDAIRTNMEYLYTDSFDNIDVASHTTNGALPFATGGEFWVFQRVEPDMRLIIMDEVGSGCITQFSLYIHRPKNDDSDAFRVHILVDDTTVVLDEAYKGLGSSPLFGAPLGGFGNPVRGNVYTYAPICYTSSLKVSMTRSPGKFPVGPWDIHR